MMGSTNGQRPYSDEFAVHVQDCSNILTVVYHMLLKSDRNFDASIVRTCIEILNREFVAGMPLRRPEVIPTPMSTAASVHTQAPEA